MNHSHLTPQQQKYLQRNSLVNNPQALATGQQLEYVSERHGGSGNSQYDNVKMAMLAQHHQMLMLQHQKHAHQSSTGRTELQSSCILKDLKRDEPEHERQKQLAYLQKQHQEIRAMYDLNKAKQPGTGLLHPEIIQNPALQVSKQASFDRRFQKSKQSSQAGQPTSGAEAQAQALQYKKQQRLRELSDQQRQPRNYLHSESEEVRLSKNDFKQVRGLNTHGKQTKRMKKEAAAEDSQSLNGSRNQLTKSSNHGLKQSTKLSSIHYEGGQEHPFSQNAFHHNRAPSNGKTYPGQKPSAWLKSQHTPQPHSLTGHINEFTRLTQQVHLPDINENNQLSHSHL